MKIEAILKLESPTEEYWTVEVTIDQGKPETFTVDLTVDTIICRIGQRMPKTYGWGNHNSDVKAEAIIAALHYRSYLDNIL